MPGIAGSGAPTLITGSGGAGGGLAFYGDGVDGAVTFDGISTVLGFVPVSNVYTMTRDIFCTSITINPGVTLITNNFHMVCQGTLTNNGTIQWNGASAVGAAGGAPTANGLGTMYTNAIGVGGAGVGGNTGAGASGLNVANSISPGIAGNGGSSGATAGGTGGTAAVGQGSLPHTVFAAWGYIFSLTSTVQASRAGAGGAAGAGDGTNSGGGGGAGGGIVPIFSKVITGTGIIQANGGNGAAGVAGNAGGGGGGGGGGVIIVSSSVVSGAISGQTINVLGGNGGAGSGTGNPGTSGSNGKSYLIPN